MLLRKAVSTGVEHRDRYTDGEAGSQVARMNKNSSDFNTANYSVQFSSVAQSCPTLCNPMNCGMPGLPVHYQLPEFTQTHVHRVGDAI